MPDNQRILRLRHEISALREAADAVRDRPEVALAEMDARIERLESEERDEYRKLVGQALFLLELVGQNRRLRDALRAALGREGEEAGGRERT